MLRGAPVEILLNHQKKKKARKRGQKKEKKDLENTAGLKNK